ncbi:LysE family translocator [Thermogemmatispora sp.]|uniref:LysE family translocator n=1 Tax=Thermogemmatispora sp. TaxID=1968838 RepID=UPI001D55BE40|nr:LysE family transporter [Thermogemmatispora sp.]MBX5451953.1 LysE family transporter [Thermogemmatispora sp.]
MLTALFLGISYGFTAGISPGPMLGLVITQTLQHGWRAGNLVALAPLLTDLPIILLAVLLISQLPISALGWLAVAGGLFVLYLGCETALTAYRYGHTSFSSQTLPSSASTGHARGPVLWRAVVTNALNPHPYLFWGTVGAQLLIRNYEEQGAAGPALLLLSFYACLVGTKLGIAGIVNRSRHWLQGPVYRWVLFLSALLLMALGLWLLTEGLSSLL